MVQSAVYTVPDLKKEIEGPSPIHRGILVFPGDVSKMDNEADDYDCISP